MKVYIQIMNPSFQTCWDRVPVLTQDFKDRQEAAFWARTTANILDVHIRLSYPEDSNAKASLLSGSYFTKNVGEESPYKVAAIDYQLVEMPADANNT